MSLNSLLIDSGSKGWADLFVDTIKVYNDATFQGDVIQSGDLVVGGDMSVAGFIDIGDDIFIDSQPIYKEENVVLDILAQGVIKTAATIGCAIFKMKNKVSVILNRALQLESADTGNDGKIHILGLPAEYYPPQDRYISFFLHTPSNGVIVAKAKLDNNTGEILLETENNTNFTAQTGVILI